MGTLLAVDGSVPYWAFIENWLQRHAVDGWEQFGARYEAWRANRTDTAVEVSLRDRVSQLLCVSGPVLEKLESDFLSDYFCQSRVIEGVNEMLRCWRSIAVLGVVSNFLIPGAPKELLRRHGLLDNFAFVIDSASVGVRKPAPQIFQLALRHAGVPVERAKDVLMIGDDWYADVQGALTSGLQAAYFSSVERQNTDVRSIPVWETFRPTLDSAA